MKKVYGYGIAWIATALILSALPAQATAIEVEGIAPMEGGIVNAREMALQNAQEKASKQAESDAPASKPLNAGTTEGSPGAIESGNMVVLREWQVGETYHVRVVVKTTAATDSVAAGRRYRKKIAVTQFNTDKPEQTADVDNIASGFPLELLRRLENSDKFLAKLSPYVISPNARGPSQDAEAIQRMAALYESQVVIGGEILDAGTMDEGGYLGFFRHKSRRLGVEIYVYDGPTGALIARHRIDNSTKLDTTVDRNMPFASASFFATSFGQLVGKTIDSAAESIAWDLESIPFTAKIIRVSDDNVYIDAGSTSLLAPGDKLRVYHLEGSSLHGIAPNGGYGAPDAPAGTVSIAQVRPKYSICTVPPSDHPPKLAIGDLVRFDIAD